MKDRKVPIVWIITLILAAGMACQLTSPRPASWSGTPTAEARMTEIAITQAALRGEGDYVFTRTPPTIAVEETPTPTSTPTPQITSNGPWLFYAAANGSGISAYDIHTRVTHEISLPEPIIADDLVRGYAPDRGALLLRAGSVLNADELSLYQIDLPAFEVSRISSLLSITLQRQIVNQEGTRALEALTTVTRPDGLAWSPEGRFLAFTAALNNDSSDLYILDTLNNRVNRANRYLTQNASPVWAPNGQWLISQELELNRFVEDWRAAFVAGLLMPSYINQDSIYTPPPDSLEEVFVGWRNVETFISYSLTTEGPKLLRQVTLDKLRESMIYEGLFKEVAFDPNSGILAFIITQDNAIAQGLSGGIYRLLPDSTTLHFQQGGNWDNLIWDPAGMFVASGLQETILFTPDGESLFLPNQGNARLSPNGNWLIAWGDGEKSLLGARLHQSNSNHPLQTLLEGRVESLFWQPDSMGFFIQSEGVLYYFAFPGLRPIKIADGLPLDSPLEWLWVD
jgi:hypothetical protein